MIWLWFDLPMAAVMFLFGLYFYRSEGKAARFLSGYNARSEEERKKYDEAEMCRCYGKRMMNMANPFLGGALIDVFKPGVGCVLAWIAWVILFGLLLLERTRRER